MKLIPLSTFKGTREPRAYTKVSDADYEHLMQFWWTLGSHGYAVRNVKTAADKKTAMLMHHEVCQRAGIVLGGLECDHRDLDGLNNQRENLRPATSSQQKWNSAVRKHSTTGVKGVFLDKRNGHYQAKIKMGRRYVWCKTFTTIEEATAARQVKVIELQGEFANVGQ